MSSQKSARSHRLYIVLLTFGIVFSLNIKKRPMSIYKKCICELAKIERHTHTDTIVVK